MPTRGKHRTLSSVRWDVFSSVSDTTVPTLIALFVSTCVGYLPFAFLGDSISPTAEIISSSILAMVAYGATVWWVKRLRGDD